MKRLNSFLEVHLRFVLSHCLLFVLIASALLPSRAAADEYIIIAGKLLDESNNKPVEAKMTLKNLATHDIIG